MTRLMSIDGEPLTVDHCQCCGEKQPDHTLHIIAFRAFCEPCIIHPKACKTKTRAQPERITR